MKDYLLEITGVHSSEDTPLPQLERHRAWFLLGVQEPGNLRFGRQHIFLLHLPRRDASLGKPIQGKAKTKKRLCPTYGMYGYVFQYHLPEYIPDQCYYVTTVLVFEAVTKIIMAEKTARTRWQQGSV